MKLKMEAVCPSAVSVKFCCMQTAIGQDTTILILLANGTPKLMRCVEHVLYGKEETCMECLAKETNKENFGRPGYKCKNNIEVDIQEVG
jgi:hypothetical protein